jgi:hypothetical protein
MLKVFISQKPRLLLEKKLYLTSIHRHQPIFFDIHFEETYTVYFGKKRLMIVVKK